MESKDRSLQEKKKPESELVVVENKSRPSGQTTQAVAKVDQPCCDLGGAPISCISKFSICECSSPFNHSPHKMFQESSK